MGGMGGMGGMGTVGMYSMQPGGDSRERFAIQTTAIKHALFVPDCAHGRPFSGLCLAKAVSEGA